MIELYDNSTEYILRIKASALVGYTLTIISNNATLRIKQGIPFSFEIQKDKALCVEFLSPENTNSIYLLS
jgi:hypothetical protein